VLGLCAALFIAMAVKLFHLGKSLLSGTDFSAVIADILFILVLIELFRLLIIYLEEHRISVATMVEVGIVATLREVILTGAMQIEWRQMLVLSAFLLTLAVVLRYSGCGILTRTQGRRADSVMALRDFDMDEPLTCDVVAERIGARRSLVVRLARAGLIETIESESSEPLLPRRTVVQLRRMQRLRHDLGVNFSGAAIILDLVKRIEQLNSELIEMRQRLER
jgi:uncharacterized membrane protein (DUF373 family)